VQFRKGKTFRILRERAVARPPQRGEGNDMTSGPKIVHAGPRLAMGMRLRVSSKEGESNKAIPARLYAVFTCTGDLPGAIQ
jgi:hypothetical protein